MNVKMISVIVPVYNCEKYLSACLDSILTQTFSDFEIISVNDGSKDGSLKILEHYAYKDERIKIVSIENHGQAYARNLGLSLAKGEYVCFVDSDDIIDSKYLEKLMCSVLKNGSDFAACSMRRIYKMKPNWLESHFEYYLPIHQLETSTISEHPELMLSLINAPYCKLIKRSFLEVHDIGFMEGKIYEDFYFTQSLLANDPKISFVKEPLYNYHVYEGSTMTSKNSRVEDMYDVMASLIQLYKKKDKFDIFFDELEYLCIHHIAIGTVYRSTCQNFLSYFSEKKRAKKFMKKNHFSVRNKYCKKMPWFVQLYLAVMF